MVASEEEYGNGNFLGRKAVNAFGKLPLLGLVRLPALVSITTEEDEVYLVVQSEFDQLVKRF